MNVEVYLWGTQIGMLAYSPGQKEVATFEFNKEFLKYNIEVSPLKTSIKKEIYSFDDISFNTFHGLPGFIADSLPDKFGNQLIDIYFARKGKATTDITALDRLLYVGNRGMGALEYKPLLEKEIENRDSFNLDNLKELAEIILKRKEETEKKLEVLKRDEILNFLRVGASAGGARAKALIALDKDNNILDGTLKQEKECKYYLLKFDTDSNSDRDNKDPKGMTKVEYIYSLIAKKCNINMPHTSYIEDGKDFHFLIERFDRINNDKLHYVSWCGMSHAHRDSVGAYSYEQLVMTARQLKLGQDSINEIFKRAIFNIVGRNQDDHTKNFGFLMDKKGKWSLSPAFDMTYSYDPFGKWTNQHQISFNGKRDNFNINDILEFSKYCDIKENKALDVLDKTVSSFLEFNKYAEQFKLDNKLKNTVLNNLRLDIASGKKDTALEQIRKEMNSTQVKEEAAQVKNNIRKNR